MHLKKYHIYISPATKFQDSKEIPNHLLSVFDQAVQPIPIIMSLLLLVNTPSHTEEAQSRSNFTRRVHNEIGLWQCVPCLWFIALLMSLCQSITSSLTQCEVTCNCCITQKGTLKSWKWRFLGVFVDLDNLTWRWDKNVGLCLIKTAGVRIGIQTRRRCLTQCINWRTSGARLRTVRPRLETKLQLSCCEVTEPLTWSGSVTLYT